jgi:hypothetical protein
MAVTRKNRTRKNESVQMGGKKIVSVGSRRMVISGTAKRTAGGLTKKDLFLNKRGRIVSRKASAAGKKAIKRLRALGYIAKRGTFRLFKKADAKKTKKMRGGSPSAGFQDVQAKL